MSSRGPRPLPALLEPAVGDAQQVRRYGAAIGVKAPLFGRQLEDPLQMKADHIALRVDVEHQEVVILRVARELEASVHAFDVEDVRVFVAGSDHAVLFHREDLTTP